MIPPNKQVVALSLITLVGTVRVGGQIIDDLCAAIDFLEDYNTQSVQVGYSYSVAAWAYQTNMTDHNQEVMLLEEHEVHKFRQKTAREALQYNLNMMDDFTRRQFIRIMDIDTAVQTDETKLKRMSHIKSEMERIYNTAKVCLTPKKCLPMNPDLTRLFSTSRDYNKLLAAWKGWRDATGPKMKNLYAEYVTLSNEVLKIAGHADTGAYWRSPYETPTFESDVQALFDQLKPLYEQLHAFARRRLKTIYGEDKFPSTGHIPAHLLGDQWAQQWTPLMKEFTPYAGKHLFNVTETMVKQKYTAEKIFQLADNFFDSLGMIKMPDSFWEKSMFKKPTDGRDVVCHPSAWDFGNGRDFRIKMCTEINQHDLETAHHEMGHIEYYLQYKDLPVSFRKGANPGFHEAVGDVISLSVHTPEHMESIGLLKTISNDAETDINFLMSMALQKIAFLPFGFLIDQWRWKVFSGETQPEHYNEHWWNLRCKYQGVSSPVKRSMSDFDPGAKFHIPANVPYIRYFVSFVIQFQFHKALCDIAGHEGPLHRCDIYGSKAAGAALSNMLKLGSSKPWTDAMYLLTGQTKMDAQPLMDYFKPLLDYLREENGNDYGWEPKCPIDLPSIQKKVKVIPHKD